MRPYNAGTKNEQVKELNKGIKKVYLGIKTK